MDTYNLPLDTVICADNCEVLRLFPSQSIDIVVTSPPYDDLRNYGKHTWDFYGVAWNIARVIKQGGVIVWVVSDQTKHGSESGTSFMQALHFKELGLRQHDTMLYHTNKQPVTAKRYHNNCEYMFVFSNGEPKTFNAITEPCAWAGVGTSPSQRTTDGDLIGGKRRIIKDRKPRENIWHYESGNGKSATVKHPAAFPIGLAKDHIVSWSNEGDIVLDPFAGSGTTLLAAKILNRRFIGIEVNDEYAKACTDRLSQGVLF